MSENVRQVLRMISSGEITPEDGRARLRASGRVEPATSAQRAEQAGTAEPAVGTARTTGSDSGTGAGSHRPIAIVGMSARFAAGSDPDGVWQTLIAGRDAVREVPAHRWDAARFYDPDPSTAGKSNSRWGGFLDDIDAFDPLLFNLSGVEAERMDPQQRLFLAGCWTALEDAGYCGPAISGHQVGVFVGAPASDYVDDEQRRGAAADAQVMMGNDTAILAARISYLLNLRGPSVALNTACSSSLVALHLAVEAINSGQCEMALAGGVCLFITPGFYISASKAGMLSPNGRCATFDYRADGFVPGEGVGVVVLKDLAAACRDGDHIRGVLLGVGTNQDGKSNGLTAPNSRAQSDLQLAVYRRAGVNPETIGLVEAHGTGTALGDPIEIEALTRSFREYTDRRQFCAIGSIKTNIGHTGQAAGVASLIKCLLAFEHEQIPPTLHFEQANPRIDFAETPFYVAASATPWPRDPAAPRRAAVSSYGYGGTNAHLVVEEPPAATAPATAPGPQLFLVSAKTPQALDRRLADLADWLAGPGADRELADIAYSLHAGRQHWPKRVAVAAEDHAGLREQLTGRRCDGPATTGSLSAADQRELRGRLRDLAAAGDRAGVLATAAQAYERGLTPEVDVLYPEGGRRVPLPTYPFDQDRYWLQPADPDSSTAAQSAGSTPSITVTPIADGTERPWFAFQPRGDEFFVRDHVVNDRPVLAAMASVGLVRAAADRVGWPAQRLTGVTWHHPLPSRHPAGLHIRLIESEHGDTPARRVRFEIGLADGEWTPGVTGFLAGVDVVPATDRVDVAALRQRLPQRIDGDECYRRLAALGIAHGPAYRVIEEVVADGHEALARLRLPADLAATAGDFPLHPCLLDGAVQAMIGLAAGSPADRLQVPYALDELTAVGAVPQSCLAYVARRPDGALDIRLTDPDGEVLVVLYGLRTAALPTGSDPTGSGSRVTLHRTGWRPAQPSDEPGDDAPTLVLASGGAGETPSVPGRLVLATPGGSYERVDSDRYVINPESSADYHRLLDDLGAAARPTRIVLTLARAVDDAGHLAQSEHELAHSGGRIVHRLLALVAALTADRAAGMPQVVVCYPVDGDADGGAAAPSAVAVTGFARSALREEPELFIRTVGLPAGADGAVRLGDHWPVVAGGCATGELDLRVDAAGELWCRAVEPVNLPVDAPPPTRPGGTYVITGGTGGVGARLAGHLAAAGTNLILVSRSEPDEQTRRAVEGLTAGAASVTYAHADVADEAALGRVLAEARERFGSLTGVVHAAGAVRDSFLRDKTPDQVDEVLRGKVTGALVVDRLTADDRLDFLVFLSSVVATVGNAGQTDYGYANAVLDELAVSRERLRRLGRRHGVSVSLALPAWAGAGMAAEVSIRDARAGVPVIDDAQGLAVFDAAVHLGQPHLLALPGAADEVTRVLTAALRGDLTGGSGSASQTDAAAGAEAGAGSGSATDLLTVARDYLRETLAEELRIPLARINAAEPLEAYGIDSVLVTRLSDRFAAHFGQLPKTIFFEYQTLEELAGYLARRHPERVRELGAPAAAPGSGQHDSAAPSPAAPAVVGDPPQQRSADDDAIAVIGVAGRYPQADDLDEYWVNLARGRDCVGEIPADRWPLEGFYDPQRRPHRSYTKWGGFLSDIDKFDPVFFGVAPREADMMDPQERLFLQTVWHTLEDAGYARSTLAGGDTGVFVGVMHGQYQLLGSAPDGRMALSSYASIANRVSYFFDFHGPSIALDTMCSSSLTAIHLAYQSLRRGECRTAVAGGVNLAVHPQKYLQLSLARFASSDGRCRSFGADGDGYVPGEGVGALLLKPLADAVADGDHIHAVIRGTAINHGGKTNGYTVPNPRAQSAVISAALRDSGVEATDIGYVEAHGTGTALGDPIEMAALSQAFGQVSGRRIPIGSVKSAIGHLESAAGVAAVTKVIMQMRHRAVVPSLHSQPPNPDIDFADSPFVVATDLRDWPAGAGGRRTAAISSFGAGGANAHLVLHDWEYDQPAPADRGTQVLTLSARSEHQLRELAGRLSRQLRGRMEGTPAGRVNPGTPGGEPGADTAPAVQARIAEHVHALLGLRDGDLGPSDSLTEAGYDEVARVRLESMLTESGALAGDELPPHLDTIVAVAEHCATRRAAGDNSADSATGPDAEPDSGSGHVPVEAAPALVDVAYTLQTGREPMSTRLACVAADLGSFVEHLSRYAETGEVSAGCYQGEVPPRGPDGGPPEVPFADEAGQQYLRTLLAQRSAAPLAQAWVQGAAVPWHDWHTTVRPRRVSLVGYPFARDSHWLRAATPLAAGGVEDSAPAGPNRPAVQEQTPATATAPAAAATSGTPADSAGSPTPAGAPAPVDGARARDAVQRELVTTTATAIGLDPDRLDPRVSLIDYGFDSMALKDLADQIADRFGVPFTPAVFFEQTGVAGITDWLFTEHPDQTLAALGAAEPSDAQPDPAAEPVSAEKGTEISTYSTVAADRHTAPIEGGPGAAPIAIIGMSGRFPGSPTLEDFWHHLRAGADLVTEIPEHRWDWRELDSKDLPEDQRCPFRWGAFVDDVDAFDPLFFGLSPAEAEMMDPQQRLLLLTAWAALEDAGYRPSSLAGDSAGLFLGLQFGDYQHLMHEAGVLNVQAALGNEHSIAVNRISFLLDLHGPSEPINTACSSSLVAVHRAVRSLRSGESTIALAGGIALNLSSHSTVAAGMMGLLSPDGRCKTLDRRANGYVKGEGVGVVMLKPLADALADGDHVYAVIRGTAVNHGGRAASLTAPNPAAQAALLRTAIEEAGVDPRTIGYLELHGTGTELGDPVEINGIRSAMRQLGVDTAEPTCGIGSVKTNIGHLEPASGIAGLIKILLAMRHRTLPGMVHLDEVNPYVDLDGSPLHIVRETVDWPAPQQDGQPAPRRAGVSSFGFGGVNAHVVVEEHEASVPAATPGGDQVFVFSARTEQALTELTERMLRQVDVWLDEGKQPAPADVAYTLRVGREQLRHRLAVVASDLAGLRDRLTAALDVDGDGGAVEGLFRGTADADGEPVPADAEPATIAACWVAGGVVDWTTASAVTADGWKPRRVSLPTYPFERKRYWFSAPPQPVRRPGSAAAAGAADPAGQAEPAAGAGAAVSGEAYIRGRLREILKEKLKLSDEDLDDNRPLRDYGVDSMISAMIIQVVQEELDAQISLTALVDYPTLSALSAHIDTEFFADRPVPTGQVGGGAPAAASERRNRLPAELLPINTRGNRQPSFWVHGAAGYSTWFRNLSQALGPEYPLYAFQAKGTDGHSMPQTLDEMVDHYIECMRLVQPEGPYVIGGYSFGGLVAMEMARRLHAQGETIRHLVLFDTYPATQEVVDRHECAYDPDFLQMYLVNYFLKVDENPDFAIRPADVADIPHSLRVAELARIAKVRAGLTISAEDIYLYLRGGLVCSEQAEGIYQICRMRPYDASDVLFFRATDGFTGRASEVYWQNTRILDGYDYPGEWGKIVETDFQVVDLDNDHLNMLEEPTLGVAAKHVEALLREPPALDHDRYHRFRESFDTLTHFGHELLAHGFADTGALEEPAAETGRSRARLRERLEIVPEYQRLFDASVDILEREGFLRRAEDDRLVPTDRLAQAHAALGDPEQVARRVRRLGEEHPDIADYLPLLTAAQARVFDVAAGRITGTEVIFPNGSMELVSELYKGNVQTEFYNRLAADRVADHVRQFVRRFQHSTAQVFEVGAGTGATTSFVLDALAEYADRTRFYFTDIGSAFIQMASQQYADTKVRMEFATFDIERAPDPQGIEPGSMDVVLASNVLHTTERMDTTLAQCHRLLKPGGIVVINELTQRLDYNTLTFGLTDGWWRYAEDDPRMPGSPLMSWPDWQEALLRCGFVDVEGYGVPGVQLDEQAQCLIVAMRERGQQ